MGRYDGPHFARENKHIVSVWAAKCPWNELPEDYFQEDLDGDDDDPWNPFSDDFGFGSYDIDFVDTNSAEKGQMVPIETLIAPCSYGASFKDTCAQRAKELGVAETGYVILLYNFEYDPQVTEIEESDFLRFVGVFPYDENV